MELNDQLYAEITELSEQGDAFCEAKDYQSAKEKFLLALNLVPEPKTDWEAATWLYTALGDVCFLSQSYEEAANYFYDAANCPDGAANPFIMLRLGQSLHESGGDIDKVKNYLMRAYMLVGEEIFEEDDAKYFNLIKGII